MIGWVCDLRYKQSFAQTHVLYPVDSGSQACTGKLLFLFCVVSDFPDVCLMRTIFEMFVFEL